MPFAQKKEYINNWLRPRLDHFHGAHFHEISRKISRICETLHPPLWLSFSQNQESIN